MVHSRTQSPAQLFPRPVALSQRDPPLDRGDNRLARHTSLAIVMGSLVVLALVSGAFWAGRMVEQRTQLGYLLAAAPALEQLQAATRSADSLGMMLMIQMGRLRTRR